MKMNDSLYEVKTKITLKLLIKVLLILYAVSQLKWRQNTNRFNSEVKKFAILFTTKTTI